MGLGYNIAHRHREINKIRSETFFKTLDPGAFVPPMWSGFRLFAFSKALTKVALQVLEYFCYYSTCANKIKWLISIEVIRKTPLSNGHLVLRLLFCPLPHKNPRNANAFRGFPFPHMMPCSFRAFSQLKAALSCQGFVQTPEALKLYVLLPILREVFASM